MDSVRGLRHRGGRPLNTGAALQYVRDNVFTSSSVGASKVMILLCGIQCSQLSNRGCIGTTEEADLALSVSEFTELPSVQEQLSSVMSTVLVRATPVKPTETGDQVLHFKISVGGKLNHARVLTYLRSASATLILQLCKL